MTRLSKKATSIADSVAQKLGLIQVDSRKGMGAGGLHTNPVYAVHVSIPVTLKNQQKSTIETERPMIGIPGLDSLLTRFDKGSQVEILGLLGRDFLYFTKMIYNGAVGLVRIEIDMQRLSSRAAPNIPV
jgi:hypothetical protein